MYFAKTGYRQPLHWAQVSVECNCFGLGFPSMVMLHAAQGLQRVGRRAEPVHAGRCVRSSVSAFSAFLSSCFTWMQGIGYNPELQGAVLLAQTHDDGWLPLQVLQPGQHDFMSRDLVSGGAHRMATDTCTPQAVSIFLSAADVITHCLSHGPWR